MGVGRVLAMVVDPLLGGACTGREGERGGEVGGGVGEQGGLAG